MAGPALVAAAPSGRQHHLSAERYGMYVTDAEEVGDTELGTFFSGRAGRGATMRRPREAATRRSAGEVILSLRAQRGSPQ